MPLDRQLVSIPIAGGVDLKTDPRQIGAGKLASLINGAFTTLRKLTKRGAFVTSNSALPSYSGRVADYFKSDLIAGDGQWLYDWSTTDNAWHVRGCGYFADIKETQLPSDATCIGADAAVIGSNILCAYAVSGAGVKFVIKNQPTGQVVYSGVAAGSPATQVKVVPLNGYFLIFYISGAALYCQPIQASSPTTSIGALTVAFAYPLKQGINSQYFYDVAVCASRAYVAGYTTGAGGSVALRYIDGALSLSSYFAPWAMGSSCTALALFADGGSYLRAAWGEVTGPALRIAQCDLSMAESHAMVSTTPPELVFFLSGMMLGGSAWLFWGGKTTGSVVYPCSDWVTRLTIVNAWSFGGITAYRYGVRPAAKPFYTAFGAAVPTVPVIYTGATQPTLFVLGGASPGFPYLLGRALTAQAAEQTLPILPESFMATTWTFAALRYTVPSIFDYDLSSGVNVSQGYAALIEFTPAVVPTPCRAEISNNWHLTGAVLRMFDGYNVCEHGFLLNPEAIYCGDGSRNKGLPHVYFYCAVYAWTDAYGQVHRSAPSSPALGCWTQNPISPTYPVTVNVPALRVTEKTNVQVEIYRSLDGSAGGGSVLYYVGSIANGTGSTQWLSLSDTVQDVTLAKARMLYTTGGVLENDAAPPSSIMCVHKNRLFVVDALHPAQVWFSHKFTPGIAGGVGAPVEFSGAQVITADAKGDPITALASMDGKLVIFKRNQIYYVCGDGPDDTGGNSDYGDPMPLPFDVGSLPGLARSVISEPEGVTFLSAKGLFSLDRSLQLQYIGKDIEPYAMATLPNSLTLALAKPDAQQLWFMDGNGDMSVFVYDYFVGQWARWTAPADFTDLAVSPAGTLLLLGSNGQFYSTNGGYLDNGASWFQMTVETPWIRFGDLQGFQRVRRMMILADYNGPFTLNYAVYTDFNTATPTQTGTVNVAAGTPGTNLQLRVDLVQQKCEAIKIVLSDAQYQTGGQGLQLSGFSLEVGIKKGTHKLPVAQIKG